MRSGIAFLFAITVTAEQGFRPPSVPLFSNSPYYAVWSAADNLTAASASWGLNGDTTEMTAAAIVDGVPYRVMGEATGPQVWTIEMSHDIPGSDLPGMPMNLGSNGTWQECQSRCNQREDCVGFAFGPASCGFDPAYAQCWLKAGITGAVGNLCRDFGIKPTPGRGFPINRTAQQLDLDVFPTRTLYQLQAGPVLLNLTFTTPFVPGESTEAAWAREASTFDVSAASADGKEHSLSFYFDATADLVTDQRSVAVSYGLSPSKKAALAQTVWVKPTNPETLMEMQSKDRASYGTLVLAAAKGWSTGIDAAAHSRGSFASASALPRGQATHNSGNSTPGTDNPVLAAGAAATVPAGGVVAVGEGPIAVGLSMDPAFLWFGVPLRPYWTQLYGDAYSMTEAAVEEAAAVQEACEAFDANVTSQLQAAGGDDYRLVGSLAYRQSWASTTEVWVGDNGTSPVRRFLMLKEISSGSDSQTSDVIYPAFPLYGVMHPAHAWRLLVPLMEYANNNTAIPYNLAWAPHHLGKYPVADILPSQEEQMPIEETAFMLISLAWLEARLGDGTSPWLPKQYWPLVDGWAEYLVSTTEIPRNQLTTDDFLGPMPNCTNLAAKGIIGLEAYARLVTARGDKAKAAQYRAIASDYVSFWKAHSISPAGDHYQLEYAENDSWSTKYNFMLQYALAALDGKPRDRAADSFPFPSAVVDMELSFYNNKQFNKYGVPLYSKATFMKADWFAFTGAMMDDAGFRRTMAALRAFLNDTPQRVPFTDWYDSITANQQGFRCRAVVGGMFARFMVQ